MLLKGVYLISTLFIVTMVSFSCIAKHGMEPSLIGKVESGTYEIKFDSPQQVILGLGVEIQSDRFGPNYINSDPIAGVPYELKETEKDRLAEALSGFRYLRLAMGLWFRGQTENRKNIVERYPGQLESIKRLMDDSGMEGISMEYWSPAPYWKSTDDFRKGTLKSFEPDFLNKFSDAVVRDMQYLQDNEIKISTFGLQNEANLKGDNVGYPHCYYSAEDYFKAFKVVAPKVRKTAPDAEIIVDAWHGNVGVIAKEIKKDPEALQYVDAWVYHRIGLDANTLIEGQHRYLEDHRDITIYQNEYEYFDYQVDRTTGEWRMVNIAQSIMNWMTFIGSQKWYWLHALKATSDNFSEGFGLGVFRPQSDNNYNRYPDIEKGEFKITWSNYNGLAGFLKHMPWDSQRYEVKEDSVRYDHRIMAWKMPSGKYAFALTNRTDEPFDFMMEVDKKRTFNGYRYNRDEIDKKLPKISNLESFTIRLKPWSIEFWVED